METELAKPKSIRAEVAGLNNAASLLSWDQQDRIQRITGSGIDPAPYMRYLQARYGAIDAL